MCRTPYLHTNISKENEMRIVTTEGVAQHRIVETKGQVFGVVVRSRGLGGNIMAGLRRPGGGAGKACASPLADARRGGSDRVVHTGTATRPHAAVRVRVGCSGIGCT